MSTNWTAERVICLDDIELKNLLENARLRGNNFVMSLCGVEISRRKTVAKELRPAPAKQAAGRVAKGSSYRNIEIDADALLVTLAHKLVEVYDLSEETARKLSTKNFRAHRLLSKNSKQSKIGGVKKRGEVAIYRFISYRINDESVSLAAVMIDKNDTDVFWMVNGPIRLLPNQESCSFGEEICIGVWCNQFIDAEAQFIKLLDALAPKK